MDSAVSVIVPSYNRAHLLPRALASIVPQLRRGDRVVVADDGSSDGTEALVASWGGPVRHLRLPHGGAGAARNGGWREVDTPLVAFLDSDDEWLPGKLDLQRALMAARPELVACFSDFRTAGADGVHHGGGLATWNGGSVRFPGEAGPAQRLDSLLPDRPGDAALTVHIGSFHAPSMRHSCVNIGTLVARRDAVGPELGCDETVPTFEELGAVATIMRAGPAAFLQAETLVQHDHAGPRLTRAAELARRRTRVALLERVWGADPAFVARHGSEHAALLQDARRLLIRELLACGLQAEARGELRRLPNPSLPIMLLASLPRPALTALLSLRRGGRETARAAARLLPFVPTVL